MELERRVAAERAAADDARAALASAQQQLERRVAAERAAADDARAALASAQQQLAGAAQAVAERDALRQQVWRGAQAGGVDRRAACARQASAQGTSSLGTGGVACQQPGRWMGGMSTA
eukprot:364797-Chlamydomonas_euryale.AAC.8